MKNVFVAALVALSLFLTGCGENEDPVTAEVEAGRPATPPPANPDETDTALTQTVEIGEERSPQEGGILTDPRHGGTPEVPTSTTTVATPGATTTPTAP